MVQEMNDVRVPWQFIELLKQQIVTTPFTAESHREEPEPEGCVSAAEGGGEGVWGDDGPAGHASGLLPPQPDRPGKPHGPPLSTGAHSIQHRVRNHSATQNPI